MTPLISISKGADQISGKTVGNGRPVVFVPLVFPTMEQREQMFRNWFEKIKNRSGEIRIGENDLKVLLAYCGTHFRTLSELFSVLGKGNDVERVIETLKNDPMLLHYNHVRFFVFDIYIFFYDFKF